MQAFDESDFLDVEIFACELEFFCQRYLLPVGVGEDATHEVAELNDHGDGRVVSLLANEAGDGVEGVEEKVRLDLAAESAELRGDELLVEAGGFGLLEGEPLSGVEQVADEEDRGVEDEG